MLTLPNKWIALLLALWLPLVTGGALAASVSMQLPHGGCHEQMRHAAAGDHHHFADGKSQHRADSSCNGCGVCHLAGAYLAAPAVEMLAPQPDRQALTPYLASFSSVALAPLDPPPVARL